jgi:hypothetical protein
VTPAEPERVSVAQALRNISTATDLTASLRARTEGLTWVLWGFAAAGQYATFALNGGSETGPRAAPGGPVLVLAWSLAALLATVGLWRSAALSFTTGMMTRRTTFFFVGWLVLFVAVALAFSLAGGASRADATVAAWGVLLLSFAAFDPLRFTAGGRWVAAAAGLAGLAAALAIWRLALAGAGSLLLAGCALGGALLAGGLVMLFRG